MVAIFFGKNGADKWKKIISTYPDERGHTVMLEHNDIEGNIRMRDNLYDNTQKIIFALNVRLGDLGYPIWAVKFLISAMLMCLSHPMERPTAQQLVYIFSSFKEALLDGREVDFLTTLNEAREKYPTPEGYFSDEMEMRYDFIYHLKHQKAYEILKNAMPSLPQPSTSPSPNPTPSSPSPEIVTTNPVTSTGGDATVKLISDFESMKTADTNDTDKTETPTASVKAKGATLHLPQPSANPFLNLLLSILSFVKRLFSTFANTPPSISFPIGPTLIAHGQTDIPRPVMFPDVGAISELIRNFEYIRITSASDMHGKRAHAHGSHRTNHIHSTTHTGKKC
jgi:hypothetical protein